MKINDLSIGDVVVLDNCVYEVENVSRKTGKVTVKHFEPIDETCNPKCAETRTLTARQFEEAQQ